MPGLPASRALRLGVDRAAMTCDCARGMHARLWSCQPQRLSCQLSLPVFWGASAFLRRIPTVLLGP